MIPLQTGIGTALSIGIHVLALAVLAGAVAGVVAAGYRLYARETMPARLGVLVGLSAVALWLNTFVALTQYVDAGADPLAPALAVRNVLAFVASAGTADLGRRVGDRVAANSSVLAGAGSVDGEVSPLVKVVGRVITVTLSATVEDAPGYEPIPDRVKEELAGATFVFPRGLTVAALHDRLETRLADDYEIGHVDCEIDTDGSVTSLAVGLRASGLGPRLAPDRAAVAIHADPAPDASPGDVVELWCDGERITTGELRDADTAVATVAIDADELPLGTEEHRLVTVTGTNGAERAARALLRAGVTDRRVDAELAGTRVRAYDGIVLAIDGTDATALPAPDRRLEKGEVIYVLDQAATA